MEEVQYDTTIAVDLGNKFIKIKSSKNSYCFVNAMFPREQAGKSLLGTYINWKKPKIFSTSLNEHKEMYFGPDLSEIGHETEWISSIGDGLSRYSSVEFQVMFEYAIALAVSDFEEEDVHIQLVTGLPTLDEKNEEIKQCLVEFLSGTHEVKIQDEISNEVFDITYTIDSIVVVPQYYGTLSHLAIDEDLNLKENRVTQENVGVVDFGGGGILIDVAHRLDLGASGFAWQEDLGVDAFHRAVDVNSALSVYTIESLYIEGSETEEYLYEPGNSKRVSDFTPAFMEQRRRATEHVKNLYSRHFRKNEDISVIFQTGGGADFLLQKEL
ncbi:MAG: hypothetical protein ACRC90_05135, partial [Lactococcus garvieae]